MIKEYHLSIGDSDIIVTLGLFLLLVLKIMCLFTK